MDAEKTWVERLQVHVLRWLVKGSGSAWVLAGTLAFAGFSAAALNAPAGASGQQNQNIVGTSNLPLSNGLCYRDPDGDGHIFCDGSVSISSLPASYGTCFRDMDGDGHIFCDGISR